MGEYIYEAIGLYTINFSTDHSFLSTIDCLRHRTLHVFWGPIYLINHDCRPNVEYIKVTNTCSMIVQALRPIKAGEELFVNYRSNFWDGPGYGPCTVHASDVGTAFVPPVGPMAQQDTFRNWGTTGS
ncbi:hypothetical protein DFH06DRAFT_1350230 [Mycena polygramma]|nr:hypothetical protein DFH06DRAFT_1350230 [Mycena polygramma]